MNPFADITLLIVDDEPEIRSGLRSIISWENYSVTVIGTARSGAEALDMIRFYEPDIVITDIQMPGINGLDLIRKAKEEQFEGSFVILSGYDDFKYAKAAIRYGVEDYLLKPISIQELTELVKKLCQSIEARRERHSDQLTTLHTLRNAQVTLKKQNLIPQLLRGELSGAGLKEALTEYSLPIRDAECRAVLFQAFPKTADRDSEEDLWRCTCNLKKVLEELAENLPLMITELPSLALLLISNLPSLEEFLETAIKKSMKEENCRIVAAMGNTVSSLLSIQASYQTARQVMTWHIYPELGSIISDSITDFLQPPIILPGNELLDCILKDEREGIRFQFHKYLTSLRYLPIPPPSYLYSMCNYLIIDLRSQLSKVMEGGPKSFTGNSYLTLQSLSSLEEIESWMCEILCKYAEELSVSRASRTDPLIEKAIVYINQNILKNIRTEDVCSYLGMSKSYFSTYFKNKTNLNFRDYTLDLKISYAQERLKLDQSTPTETAISLGYEDYRSFSRAFKTRTGMTPSDYQRQYLAGGFSI